MPKTNTTMTSKQSSQKTWLGTINWSVLQKASQTRENHYLRQFSATLSLHWLPSLVRSSGLDAAHAQSPTSTRTQANMDSHTHTHIHTHTHTARTLVKDAWCMRTYARTRGGAYAHAHDTHVHTHASSMKVMAKVTTTLLSGVLQTFRKML